MKVLNNKIQLRIRTELPSQWNCDKTYAVGSGAY